MKFYSIIFIVLLNVSSAQNVVFWEPEIPVSGGDITIYYNTIEGTLPDDTTPVYIHLGYNGWQNTDDYEMSYAPDVGNGWWRYIYSIPQDAETIDFVFTDLDGNWDNNGGIGLDWHISLSYYWSPFSPNPNDTVSIFLDNVDQGGHIAWTIDAGMGHELPIEEYWPNDSFVEDEYLFTPLIENGANSYTVELGSFLNGDQVINSIKFKIRWDDGSWDEGSNGQIMFYDIYLDYTPTEEDPYVFFISPTPDEGAEVSGSVSFSVVGSAEYVEFWVNGELIETDSSSPFQATWYPDENLFGETTGIIRAIGENGRVTYLFRDFYLLYSIVNEPVPDGTNDGVNIDGNTVIIALYAPYKDYVAIKGSWNSQFVDGELMKLSGDTLWWYQIELEDGAYTYQYNLEGEKNIADPWSKDVTWLDPSGQWESSDYAHAKTAFSVGNDEFVWTDENFVRPEQKDVIIYEMHIGDFNGDPLNTGIFQDVTEKIQEGYFNDLGINTIELMPVNECQGDWSWGYNPSFYMAPESSYGTPEDLKELVNTAHTHGIAVLFDVVFNHLWGSAPLFQLYQPLDNWDYEDHNYAQCPYFHNEESPWGYKLQHWHEVDGRQYRAWKHISDVLLSYVYDYHADGFRFDVTAGIGWGGDENGSSFYADLLDDIDPSFILVAEEDNPYQINNSDFDSGWDWSYHHAIFNNLMGYSSNMWEIQNHLQWWSQNWSEHTQPCNYTVSHDETRIIYEALTYANMNLEEAYKKSKLGAAALFTGTGTPMMYHGQEFGQNSPVSLDPQPLQWENLETPEGVDLYNFFRKLIWLRNNWAVIRGPNLEIIYINNSQKVIGMKRHDDSLGQTVYTVMNFSGDDQTISELPFPYAGTWYEFTEDSELESESGSYTDYTIPGSASRVYTNFRNWGDEAQTVMVHHIAGWNIVGLPLNVDDASPGSLYPSSVEGTLYGFDGSYYNTGELTAGNGYWLYFNETGDIELNGTSIDQITMSLNQGWNLITGITLSVETEMIGDPEGILVSGTIYGFDGSYFNATILTPGAGYWAFASADGNITIPSGSRQAKTNSTFVSRTNGANSITLNNQTLYFGMEIPGEEILSYQLPPKPPIGAFDVRFSGDWKYCGDSGVIEVMNTKETLVIEYNVNGGELWELVDENSGIAELQGSGQIKLHGDVSQLELRKSISDVIPKTFVLHPVYPNPFNPVTTIHFTVGQSIGKVVELTIYDINGRLVESLVNKELRPGEYQMKWDGVNQPSGLYILRLKLGKNEHSQKIMLLK